MDKGQRERLTAILLGRDGDAPFTELELAAALQTSFPVPIGNFIPENVTPEQAVFALLERVESEGWDAALVRGLYVARPHSARLRALAKEILDERALGEIASRVRDKMRQERLPRVWLAVDGVLLLAVAVAYVAALQREAFGPSTLARTAPVAVVAFTAIAALSWIARVASSVPQASVLLLRATRHSVVQIAMQIPLAALAVWLGMRAGAMVRTSVTCDSVPTAECRLVSEDDGHVPACRTQPWLRRRGTVECTVPGGEWRPWRHRVAPELEVSPVRMPAWTCTQKGPASVVPRVDGFAGRIVKWSLLVARSSFVSREPATFAVSRRVPGTRQYQIEVAQVVAPVSSDSSPPPCRTYPWGTDASAILWPICSDRDRFGVTLLMRDDVPATNPPPDLASVRISVRGSSHEEHDLPCR